MAIQILVKNTNAFKSSRKDCRMESFCLLTFKSVMHKYPVKICGTKNFNRVNIRGRNANIFKNYYLNSNLSIFFGVLNYRNMTYIIYNIILYLGISTWKLQQHMLVFMFPSVWT